VPRHLYCKSLDKDDLSNFDLGKGRAMLSHQQTCQCTTNTPSYCSLVSPFPCVPAQRDLSLPFHSLKGAMSYPPAKRDVAPYDLSLLYTVSDPIVGNNRPRDSLSAAAPLSSGPLQPQLYTTQVEKPHDSSAVAGYSPGAVSYARKEESAPKGQEPVVARVPWYRTRRGIIIIIVVAIIVVVAAAVGGAVGGTHHSSKPKSNGTDTQNSGSGNTTTTTTVTALPVASNVNSGPTTTTTVTAFPVASNPNSGPTPSVALGPTIT